MPGLSDCATSEKGALMRPGTQERAAASSRAREDEGVEGEGVPQ